jgi:hypothetical protein
LEIELNCTRARSNAGLAQALLHLAPVLALLHVDEVDDDQATQVAQPHLACDLVGRLEVGAGGGLLDVAAARGARRVDVDDTSASVWSITIAPPRAGSPCG